MSDYSPPNRRGLTKTGKSLKAVRRYYALKDASKKRRGERSPPQDADDEERGYRQDKSPSTSKRKRSPDDDKLSKRIAAELKVQQEANEKRSRGNAYSVNIAPTERSALPLYNNSQRGASPAFVAAPIQPPPPPPPTGNDYIVTGPNKSAKSAKSAKSVKSSKSFKSIGTKPMVDIANPEPVTPNTVSLGIQGFAVASFMIALIYGVTFIFLFALDYTRTIPPQYEDYSIMKQVRWLTIVSLFVLFVVPYWIALKKDFKHNLIALLIMVACTMGTITYLVFTHFINEKVPSVDLTYETDAKPEVRKLVRNQLNICLPITYLLCQIATTGLIIRQIINVVSSQIEERSMNAKMLDPQMSQYLSPN